jgi:hypothetical protein
MAYEVLLADLLEEHQEEFAEAIIAAVKLTMASVAELDFEQLRQRYIQLMAVSASYLRSGDTAQYKAYMLQFCLVSFQLGGNVESFQAISQIVIDRMKAIVEQEFAEPADHQIKNRCLQRLSSLHALNNVAVFNAYTTFNAKKGTVA